MDLPDEAKKYFYSEDTTFKIVSTFILAKKRNNFDDFQKTVKDIRKEIKNNPEKFDDIEKLTHLLNHYSQGIENKFNGQVYDLDNLTSEQIGENFNLKKKN